jgi:signal peptidase I
MSPAYPPGVRVYSAPISGEPGRGDVVLIDDGKSEYALKRVVGLPGETIQLWRGYVFVNHKMLLEPYLPKHTYTFPDERTETSRFELGHGQYFVLGDNRECSVDSRLYGPLRRDQIKSRVEGAHLDSRKCFASYTLPTRGKRTIRPW